MPEVPPAVIKERAKQLRAVGDNARARHFARREGGEDLALIEKDGFGRLADFTPVTFTPCGAKAGQLRKITLTGYDDDHMHGALV